MKSIKLLTILLALSTFVFAQTPYNMQYGAYSQTFDGLANSGTGNTLYPAGWSAFEYGSSSSADGAYRASTGTSTAGDCYSYGASNATERSLGSQASGSNSPSFGFGFTNNTGSTLTQIDIALTMEQWREGSGAGLDSCYFIYSTTATGISDTAASWTSLAALDLYSASNTTNSGALDGNQAANQIALNGSINLSLPASGTIYIKWVDINSAGSDDGLSIDDLSMTLYDANGPLPAGPPALSSTNPADNDLNVSYTATSMSMTFSDSISVIGSGNVYIRDINNSANDVTLAASALTQSTDGKTFSYNSLSLNPATAYAINIDSTCFSNGINFPGIYNNTDWNFTTVAQPTAVTSLNETFSGCNDPNFGLFSAYSEVGGQNWRCTTFGNGDTNAVRMNGFSGGSQDNEDWLISPPLDMSAMTMPVLDFYSKIRFSGNNTKELFVSTNYSGVGSPAAANWTALTVPSWSSLDTTWKQFSGIDLSSYKSSNFYIAFKYVSQSSGTADEWSVDDVRISEGANSVANFSRNDLNVTVLGETSELLHLQLSSSKERNLNYQLLDLSGRLLNSSELNIPQGYSRLNVSLPQLASGMYIIQLGNEEGRMSTKFVVQ